MKKLLLSSALMLIAYIAGAQTKAVFDAAITRFQGFYNTNQNDSLYDMLSNRGKNFMSFEKSVQSFNTLHQQFGSMRSFEFDKQEGGLATYNVEFEKMTLSLLISMDDSKLETFKFVPLGGKGRRTGKSRSNFAMKAGNDTLYGTIVSPATTLKVPVVLIIAGSGPTDRDCNSTLGLTTNSFIMLADSLEKAGIATLRYDKRGVGESLGVVKDEKSNTFDDLVTDATDCIRALKNDPRFSDIYVMGHSEGSLVGILAAQKESVNGFISLSGAGEPVDKILERQTRSKGRKMSRRLRIIADSIKAGHTPKDIPLALDPLFHKNGQPFMRAWMKYNPQTEIKKINCRVLLIQGANDKQISVADAKLLHQARPDARLVIVKGMSHVLKQAPKKRKENFATYNKPALPLSGGFVPDIVQFIKR